MIDRITISIPNCGSRVDPQSFTKLKITRPGMYWEGRIEGNHIYLKQDYDRLVITANLPKILNGENVTNLSRKQVDISCGLLEGFLGLDLGRAAVLSIEVGVSVITKETPGKYISLFADHPYLTRAHYRKAGKDESILYFSKTGGYSFTSYDKTAEVNSSKKPMPIPPIFQDQNILRLEYKIKKGLGIRAQFGKDLYLHDLHDPEVYGKLKTLFHEAYLQVPKTGREVFLNGEGMILPSDFDKACAMQFRQLFPEDCQTFLLAAKTQNLLTDDNYKRVRELFRQDNNGIVRSVSADLVAELDSRVADWVRTG